MHLAIKILSASFVWALAVTVNKKNPKMTTNVYLMIVLVNDKIKVKTYFRPVLAGLEVVWCGRFMMARI